MYHHRSNRGTYSDASEEVLCFPHRFDVRGGGQDASRLQSAPSAMRSGKTVLRSRHSAMTRGRDDVAEITKDKLCIVQFPHPGQEFPVCSTNSKLRNGFYEVPWSDMSSHYRRLIKHNGKYINGDGKFGKGELVFWNEWEGPTSAVENKKKISAISASFVHAVQLPSTSDISGRAIKCSSSCCCSGKFGDLLNTDPCVFGRTFKYSNCRQTRNGTMRRLLSPSLIVFGSRVNGEFCLDTVFVVGDTPADYVDGSDLKNCCSNTYKCLTIDRLPRGYYTFYRGITPRKRKLSEQMFSFTPARLSSEVNYSERCKLNLASLNKIAKVKAFDVNVWRNKKVTTTDNSHIKAVWNEIVRQVIGQGFVLGVRFDWPKAKAKNA